MQVEVNFYNCTHTVCVTRHVSCYQVYLTSYIKMHILNQNVDSSVHNNYNLCYRLTCISRVISGKYVIMHVFCMFQSKGLPMLCYFIWKNTGLPLFYSKICPKNSITCFILYTIFYKIENEHAIEKAHSLISIT